MLKKSVLLFSSKVKKRHITSLFLLLLPFWLIGINGYFFSSAAYRIIAGTDFTSEISRQWVGDYDGLLMTLVISAVITGLWVTGVFTGHTERFTKSFTEGIKSKVRYIKSNPGKILLHMGILLAILVAAFVTEIISSMGGSILSLTGAVRILFFATAGLSIYLIIMIRNKPEKLFLLLALFIGFLYIAAHPPAWYGWDNRIHYAMALEASFVCNVSVSEIDIMLTSIPELNGFWSLLSIENVPGDAGFRELLSEQGDFVGSIGFGDLLSSQNNYTLYLFRKGADTLSEIGPVGGIYTRIAYIPTGLMLFIGRSLGLAPLLIVKLGTLGNHLVYTFIVYLAIKRLNSGKHIMAVIAMFPTAFVLSTTYGYDHWLTAFTMLGFAYFFNEVQNPEKKAELKHLIIMTAAFVVGLGPKAVYVPLIFTLFLMSRDKFKASKDYKRYVFTVTLIIIFITVTFILPFISSGGGGEGDARGGGGVNASEQTRFVLQNPLTYAGTLLRFLGSYLNPVTNLAHNHITFFAFLGSASYYFLTLALLGFVTITDRNEYDIPTSTARYKILISLIVFLTAALFSTALYIAFTEVGANHIAGVSARYKLPLYFPFLYIVGSFKIKNNISKPAYSSCVFGIMSFVLLAGAWEKLVPHV